jgi:hypothetical protein
VPPGWFRQPNPQYGYPNMIEFAGTMMCVTGGMSRARSGIRGADVTDLPCFVTRVRSQAAQTAVDLGRATIGCQVPARRRVAVPEEEQCAGPARIRGCSRKLAGTGVSRNLRALAAALNRALRKCQEARISVKNPSNRGRRRRLEREQTSSLGFQDFSFVVLEVFAEISSG